MLVLVEGCVCLLCLFRALQHTFCPLWGVMLCIAGESNRGYGIPICFSSPCLRAACLRQEMIRTSRVAGICFAGGLAGEGAIYRSGSGIRRY